jgi:HEAT repeat protein
MMDRHQEFEDKLSALSSTPADPSLQAIISALRGATDVLSPEAKGEILRILERESPGNQNMSAASREHLRALKTGAPLARATAAWALGNSKETGAAPLLMEALAAPDAVVRVNAAWALGELQHRPAVDILIAALQDVDGWVRRHAAVALGKIGDPRAIDPLSQQRARETSATYIADINAAIAQLPPSTA